MTRELTTALLPVFLTLAIGYVAGRRGIVDNTDVDSLNRLVTTFAVPAALFVAISSTQPAQIIAHLGYMAVFTVSMAAVYAATWSLERRAYGRDQATAAVQALTVAFPNMAAVGLPLAMAVVGPQGAIAVAVGLAIGAVTFSPLTLAVLAADTGSDGGSGLKLGAFGSALATSTRKPIFWAPVLAFAVVLSGFRMPSLVEASLAPLGDAAVGVALFLTGLIVSAHRATLTSEVAVAVLVKNAVMPLLAWGLCVAFGLSRLISTEAVLLAAVPSGFFGLVFAAGYGRRSPVAETTVLVSTVAGIGSLALVVGLLP